MDYRSASPDRYALLKAERQQQEDDAVRELVLERKGFHVMRFSNEEVLYDTQNVLSQIKSYFK